MKSAAQKHSQSRKPEFTQIFKPRSAASERPTRATGAVARDFASVFLAIAFLLMGQQGFASEPATKSGAARASSKAAPSDLFMVQLNSNADRDSFDSMLKRCA